MTDRRSGFGWLLVALASVSLVPSLAAAAPRVPTHVACVGDSITYGYGASNQATKSYPANLQTLFGASVQVKNFGHNGATMLSAPFGDTPYKDQPEYTAAGSFVSGAGASAVIDVIIMLGANDSKNVNWAPSGKPKNDQQFLKDYRAMVEHFSALTPRPQVFLALPLATGNNPCCSIDGTVIHDQMLPLIKQLAAEKNLPTIDLNTPTTGHPEYFGDGVHPTDAGYAIVAGLMHDGLLADQPSGGAGGANGAGGAGGAAGSAESAGSGGAASGGTSGLAAAGSTESANGGAGAANLGGAGAANLGGAGVGVAGVGVAGAPQNPATSPGGAGTQAGVGAGGQPSLPAHSPSKGCALSGSRKGPGSPCAWGSIALAWLVARRRRAGRS